MRSESPALDDAEAVPLTLDEAYVLKLEQRVDVLDGAIHCWASQVEYVAADARRQLAQDIDALRRKQALVRECLAPLRSADRGAWHTLKSRLETAWQEFSVALERVSLPLGGA